MDESYEYIQPIHTFYIWYFLDGALWYQCRFLAPCDIKETLKGKA